MEVEHMLQDITQRLSYQGLKMEQYLKMIGKTEEEVKKEYEPQAIEAIKSRLTLEAIRKEEKIEASEEATPELKYKSTDEKKIEVVEKVIEYCKKKHYNINTIDGVRVTFTISR